MKTAAGDEAGVTAATWTSLVAGATSVDGSGVDVGGGGGVIDCRAVRPYLTPRITPYDALAAALGPKSQGTRTVYMRNYFIDRNYVISEWWWEVEGAEARDAEASWELGDCGHRRLWFR